SVRKKKANTRPVGVNRLRAGASRGKGAHENVWLKAHLFARSANWYRLCAISGRTAIVSEPKVSRAVVGWIATLVQARDELVGGHDGSEFATKASRQAPDCGLR